MKTRGIHVALLLWLLTVKRVKTGGKLDIRLIRYSSDGRTISGYCCDTLCLDKCDPKFFLRIDGSDGGNLCSLYKGMTNYVDNHNTIQFGGSIQGTPNPFIIHVDKTLPSSIKILVQVYDHDGEYSQDHMDTLSEVINIQAAATKRTALYTTHTLRGRTELEIAVRAYCDLDWYGSTCEKYCKATTDHGHYSCHLHSGAKMCHEGWKGEKCNQDIDECTEIDNTCQNGGSCLNLDGGFQCNCTKGVEGRRCENIISQCALAPCLNGGTCDGNETDFTCACSGVWTGKNCTEKVNFCDSAPCNRGNCTPDLLTATRFTCNCDFAWTGDRCTLHVDIVNITLLGEIDDTNRGDLADGLKILITELGEITGKVDVKFMTKSHIENNFTTTYVQLYSVVENGSFIESPLLGEIFESHSDKVINEYLPLSLYPPREEEKATLKVTPLLPSVVVTKSPHDSWDTDQYVSAILPPVGLVLMSVLILMAFFIWRRSERMGKVTDDDQLDLFVINVPCNRSLNRAGYVSFREDASLSPVDDTSIGFHQVEVVTLDTVCNETSDSQLKDEDETSDPLSSQGSSVSDNARLSDAATPGTCSHITSLMHPGTEALTLGLVPLQGASVSVNDDRRHGDATTLDTRRHVTSNIQPVTEDVTINPEGLPSGCVAPDDHSCLNDFGTPGNRCHVTSYTPLDVLPCTSGSGLSKNSNYDPLDRCEEEDEECTVVYDNNVEDTSEENPYVDLVVMKR